MKALRFNLFILLVFFIGFISIPTANASDPSPVGHWRTIDDVTGRAKGIVELKLSGDKLMGYIAKVFPEPDGTIKTHCTECRGSRKNAPAIGLNVVWGLKFDGKQWSGGSILDPDNGNIYRCFIKVSPNGKKLTVRGYLGFAIIGRTQYWHRVK